MHHTQSKKIIVIFVSAAVFAAAFFWTKNIIKIKEIEPSLKTPVFGMSAVLFIKEQKLLVEIADTAEKRTNGLSGKKNLAENEGMFFIFETPYQYSFWMKDMNFPIDIIWIGENLRVADITENLAPETFPQNFRPKSPVKYVLEVNAGWTKKRAAKIGDEVKLEINKQ